MPGAEPDGRPPLRGAAEAVSDVVEKTQSIVQDEIALAKAEITEKVSSLARGAVVGIVAGFFVAVGGLFLLHGLALLVWYLLFPGDAVFWGYLIVAAILFVLAVVGGLVAFRAVKKGSPPVPKMAIEEATLVKGTLTNAGAGTPGTAVRAPEPVPGPAVSVEKKGTS